VHSSRCCPDEQLEPPSQLWATSRHRPDVEPVGRAPPGRRLTHACPAAARLGRSPQAAAVRGTRTRIQIETRDLSLEVGTDERREADERALEI